MFDVHSLERKYEEIDVSDSAFERIFDFFDEFEWHLDTRENASGNEINPDVLGYIFEKYINQQQMGAYYTKEDITGFITSRTICARVLDSAGLLPIARRLIHTEPTRYLPSAGLHGLDRELPHEVAIGITNVDQRARWNHKAPEEFGLPDETWRDCVARRGHWTAVHDSLRSAEVGTASDLVGLNLDLPALILDCITSMRSAAEVNALMVGLQGIRVLDPTCGSGAFLFAALNLFEIFYDACLSRLEDLVPEHETTDGLEILWARSGNVRYAILKSVVLNNLYGVDLMEEAVEICKLRLFLKLVAQVRSKEELAPLPDIDFNIRAGNALVGYSTLDDARSDLESRFDFAATWPEIEGLIETVDSMSGDFRRVQTDATLTSAHGSNLKTHLTAALAELRLVLDDASASRHKVAVGAARDTWVRDAHPFHWCVEFHAEMSRGGFDVVVGNPPYVRLSKVKDYQPLGYLTQPCGDLYPLVMERAFALASPRAHIGWIVPVSSLAAEGFETLHNLLKSHTVSTSSYDDRPSRLFEGLEHVRLAIHLIEAGGTARFSTSRYHRWRKTERPTLFANIRYTDSTTNLVPNSVPKLAGPLDVLILQKLAGARATIAESVAKSGGGEVRYTRKVGSFVQVLDFIPTLIDSNGSVRQPSELKTLKFKSDAEAMVVIAGLNSSLFYWFTRVFSDCRNLNSREIMNFPLAVARVVSSPVGPKLIELAMELMKEVRATSEMRVMGALTVQCTFPGRSRLLLNQIDNALGEWFGLTAEELDWVINFDQKYRYSDE